MTKDAHAVPAIAARRVRSPHVSSGMPAGARGRAALLDDLDAFVAA
jgi:hypothetical protein